MLEATHHFVRFCHALHFFAEMVCINLFVMTFVTGKSIEFLGCWL
jgi:hypothetical protein